MEVLLAQKTWAVQGQKTRGMQKGWGRETKQNNNSNKPQALFLSRLSFPVGVWASHPLWVCFWLSKARVSSSMISNILYASKNHILCVTKETLFWQGGEPQFPPFSTI